MKKTFLILSFVLLFILSSCSVEGMNMFFRIDNNEQIADKTFNKIINTIKQKDESEFAKLFSKSTQNGNNLLQDARKLMDFIHGDIVSISAASESGVITEYEKDKGKIKKEIQSSFCIVTSETKYYMAIKECTRNDFDSDKIGILSIYIIEASNWTVTYVYRGDGSWIPGINIVDSI